MLNQQELDQIKSVMKDVMSDAVKELKEEIKSVRGELMERI